MRLSGLLLWYEWLTKANVLLSQWYWGLIFSAYNFKTCSTFETMACCTQKVVALATQCGEDDGYSVRTQVTSPSALKERHSAPSGISLAHLKIHMKIHNSQGIMPTSYPFNEGPTKTTGLMEGTTSYGGTCSAYKMTHSLQIIQWNKDVLIIYCILLLKCKLFIWPRKCQGKIYLPNCPVTDAVFL